MKNIIVGKKKVEKKIWWQEVATSYREGEGNLIRGKINWEVWNRKEKKSKRMERRRGRTLLKGPCGEHVGIAMCSFSVRQCQIPSARKIELPWGLTDSYQHVFRILPIFFSFPPNYSCVRPSLSHTIWTLANFSPLYKYIHTHDLIWSRNANYTQLYTFNFVMDIYRYSLCQVVFVFASLY